MVPRISNSIADSLSRDFHINNTPLCDLLLSHFPDQAPLGLTILPVPPDIVSWLTCLLLSQLLKEPWLKEPMQSNFTLGLGFNATSTPLDSTLTPTSIVFPSFNDQRFLAPSLTPSKWYGKSGKTIKSDSVRSALDCISQAFKFGFHDMYL
jgi:hypothetical protein